MFTNTPINITMKKAPGRMKLIFSTTTLEGVTKSSEISISRNKGEIILRDLGITESNKSQPHLDVLYMYNSKTTYSTEGTPYRIWLRIRKMNVQKFHQSVQPSWRDYQGFAKWYYENKKPGTYLLVNYSMENEVNESNTYFTMDKTGAYQSSCQ